MPAVPEVSANTIASENVRTVGEPRIPLLAPLKPHKPNKALSGFYLIWIAGFLVSLLRLYYKRREAIAALSYVRSRSPAAMQTHAKREPAVSNRA